MNDDTTYNDDDAIRFIRNYLPQDMKEKFSDDDIIYIIDLISDFCDSSGYLDFDDDTVVDIDEDELIMYVEKNARRDGVTHFERDEIMFIVQGELEYCGLDSSD
ncbi:MAG: hypothetical protein LBK07_03850 [Tannerella sp.]|jgi:hypothetical protein|nr:hypothetical protein [Tannerella sp.]